MRVLLKVGYDTYLLPNDNGLQTVVKALSAALQCNDKTFLRSNPCVDVDPDLMEVSVKYLSPKTKITFKGSIEEEPAEILRLIAPTTIIPPPPKS